MALTDQVIMPGSDYQAICDATRSLTGKTGTLKSGDISTELGTIGIVEQATPSLTLNAATGVVTAEATQAAGLVAAGTKKATKQLATQSAKTVTPSNSSQTAVSSGVYTTGAVTVAAVPTETKTVTPVWVEDSSINYVSPSNGKFLTKVALKKPSTLIPSNIKKGVSIGGVVGAIPEIATDSLLDGVLTHNGALNIAGDTATLNVYITLDPHATLAEGHMILSEIGNTIKPVTVPTEIVGITPTWTVSSSSTSYNPTSGRLIRSVVVNKPSTLIPSNIKKGVAIGGIAGTYTGDDVFIREVSTVTATTSQGVITFTTSSLARYLYAFVIRNGTKSYASADIRSISSCRSIRDNEGLSITRKDGSYKYSWSIFNSEELNYDGANMTVYIMYESE